MRKKHWMLSPWFIIFSVVMLLMTTISANYNLIVFYVELGITVLSIALVMMFSLRFSAYIRGIVKSTADRINGIDHKYLERYKYPVAVVGTEGDIVWCNTRFRKAIGGRKPEGDHINHYISGYDIVDIVDCEGVDVAIDGREFTVYCMDADGSVICHFIESRYPSSMMQAAILSTTALFCRSFFFMPPAIIAWCANTEVKRSSYIVIGIAGNCFLKLPMNGRI